MIEKFINKNKIIKCIKNKNLIFFFWDFEFLYFITSKFNNKVNYYIYILLNKSGTKFKNLFNIRKKYCFYYFVTIKYIYY